MFVMDAPYMPEQPEPIVFAQENSKSSSRQADYVLKVCQEIQSTGEFRSAMHSIVPQDFLRIFMKRQMGYTIDPSEFGDPILLEAPKHGSLVGVIGDANYKFFYYDPIPEYDGVENAAFQIEYQGKVYQVDFDLRIAKGVAENSPQCPEENPILLPTQSLSGMIEYLGFTFTDLPNSALAQITDTGPAAQITFDLDAAGYGWYIDYTPYLNEEYLPTSNLCELDSSFP
ncbi:MAG: hypothetical protein LBI59_01580 [Candidatus Accumulibacter sp.]|nr:hypothetical protein [Accumulibacter sp.]